MSAKASRQRNARARALAEVRRQEQARRRRIAFSGVAVIAVLAVLGAMVAIKVLSGPTQKISGPAGDVPTADLQRVAAAPTDGVPQQMSRGISLPKPVNGKAALTDQGKPEVLYIGAEFCPYCAAERWPLVIALSRRFGRFSGLRVSHSAPTPEVYPNTATFSFRDAHYASRYVSFVSVENQDERHNPLQAVSKQQHSLWTSISGGQGFPFVDLGNRY